MRSKLLTLAALVAIALAGCGSSSSGGGGKSASLHFTLTSQGCVPATSSVPAGPVTINVSNGGSPVVTELELQNSAGLILGERENVEPGLSGTFSLDLQPGHYLLNCPDNKLNKGHLTVTGKPFHTATATGAALKTAVLQYRTFVEGEIHELLEGTRRFTAAIVRGDKAEAQRLFGPVRRHYETIEPIADSFEGLDSNIDARIDAPTVLGNFNKWFGFHRIEYAMWHQHTLAGTVPLADQLLGNVEKLSREVPTLPLEATQMINGAVELLNEITNVKITGEEDRYSHTDLSDFQGNLAGARKAFQTVRPALSADAATYDGIERQLQEVQHVLDGYRRDTPLGFALYGSLTNADKRLIATKVGEAAQALTGVVQRLATGQ
jgi:iron uptake system component EfeO